LSICVCYLCENALTFGVDAPVDNVYGWKGIREKAGEVNNAKNYKELCDFPLSSQRVYVRITHKIREGLIKLKIYYCGETNFGT
jgi:hypothetical protein